jgi:hypothetical protein
MFYSWNRAKGRDRAGLLLPQTAAFIRSFLTMRAAHREFQSRLFAGHDLSHTSGNLTTKVEERGDQLFAKTR